MRFDPLVTSRMRSKVAMALLISLCLCGVGRGAPGPDESTSLAVVGIVAPSRLVVTPARASATKPVVVVVENQSSQNIVIADAMTLRGLVELEVQPSLAIPAPRLVLVPPRQFPITLRPQHKLSLVFQVKFELRDAPPGAMALAYHATTPQALAGAATPLEAETSPTARQSLLARTNEVSAASFGPDNGATVTAKPLRVPLKKDESQSDPITFKAAWPGKSVLCLGLGMHAGRRRRLPDS